MLQTDTSEPTAGIEPISRSLQLVRTGSKASFNGEPERLLQPHVNGNPKSDTHLHCKSAEPIPERVAMMVTTYAPALAMWLGPLYVQRVMGKNSYDPGATYDPALRPWQTGIKRFAAFPSSTSPQSRST
jgi:hypothetical protein